MESKKNNYILSVLSEKINKKNADLDLSKEDIDELKAEVENINLETQNKKDNKKNIRKNIDYLLDLYKRKRQIMNLVKEKLSESQITLSGEQIKSIDQEFKILLENKKDNKSDIVNQINILIKKYVPNYEFYEKKDNLAKIKKSSLGLEYKILYAFQVCLSLFLIQETVYQTDRIATMGEKNKFAYVSLSIINGLRALYGLLGENIDFAYLHNYIPARIANFFREKGEESNSIFNIIKYFAILGFAQSVCGEFIYDAIDNKIQNNFALDFNSTSSYTVYSNFSNVKQRNYLFVEKYFKETINFAWYLIIDVNICVFARSLLLPYLNKKFFQSEFPFFEVNIEFNGKKVIIYNENYTGKSYYQFIDEEKYMLIDLNKNYKKRDVINLQNACIKLMKQGEFKTFSPDIKSRSFSLQSILKRHGLFLISGAFVPFIEYSLVKTLDPNSFARFFVHGFGEVFCLYGAGFASVSDFYLKIFSKIESRIKSNKVKLCYQFLIQSISIGTFGINRFFFNEKILILNQSLFLNNVFKRVIGNSVTASGIFFENIHFGIFCESLKNFEQSIQTKEIYKNNLDEIKKQICSLEEIKNKNDFYIQLNIYINVINITAEFVKLYKIVTNYESLIDYSNDKIVHSYVLIKNIFMCLVITNSHFYHSSKAKIINKKLKELYDLLYEKESELKIFEDELLEIIQENSIENLNEGEGLFKEFTVNESILFIDDISSIDTNKQSNFSNF